MKCLAFGLVVLCAACGRDAPQAAGATPACPIASPALGPGIGLERWHVTRAIPVAGEPCIDVVRFDPARYQLRAFTSDDGAARPATRWATDLALVAAINAGMFHEGGEPVGLVIRDTEVRGRDNDKFGGYFAWDPTTSTDPAAIVLGKPCPNAARRAAYRSLVQSYRLLDCDGSAIAWQDPKHYSAAAIGTDRTGRIVLVHVRGAFTMRDLSAELAAHDLAGAIFLEGGPEASLVVRGPTGAVLERVGSYETGFVENDDNTAFWDLPNVIGIVAR